MSHQTSLVNATLLVYGGFVLTEDQIDRFLAANNVARTDADQRPPASAIDSYLRSKDFNFPVGTCLLKPLQTNEDEDEDDNPTMTIVHFAQRSVKYADVEITNDGVVPYTVHAASDAAKERVRKWLQLPLAPDDTCYEAHVADIAGRIFYVGVEDNGKGIGPFSDESIERLFKQIGEITEKEPRDLEFHIVYDEDQMEVLLAYEKWAGEMLEEQQEAIKLAQGVNTPAKQ